MQELRNNPSTPDWKKIRAELQRPAKVVRAQFQRLRRQLDSQGTSQTATYLAGFMKLLQTGCNAGIITHKNSWWGKKHVFFALLVFFPQQKKTFFFKPNPGLFVFHHST